MPRPTPCLIPLAIRLRLPPRVNTHLTATIPIRLPNRDLQLHRTAPLEHQRPFERQLLHHLATNPTTRRQHQLKKTRTRQQHRIQHRMISKPRMSISDNRPVNNHPSTTRDLHRRPKQRVIRSPQPHTTSITHTHPRASQ